MRDYTKYFYAFSLDERFSFSFVQLLYNHFNDIEHAWKCTHNELVNTNGINIKKAREFIDFRESIDIDKLYSEFLKSDISYRLQTD